MTVRLNETKFGPKKKSSPIYLSPKNLDTLMHWMSVKLPDNFQIREHSWPCPFHIKIKQDFNFTTLKGFKIIKLTTCDRFYNKKNPAPFMVFDSFSHLFLS